jgi:putative addiction module killer protein
MITREIEVRVFRLKNGQAPFELWRGRLELTTRAHITRRVGRMRLGNFGDWRSVGSGEFELRIHWGPGYRIYYARHGERLVLLLGGGEKRSQEKDIAEAKRLWQECKNEIS